MNNIQSHSLTRVLLSRHLRLSIPISLQILLRFLIQFVDNVVVGQLGETAVAGVAISNQVFFIYILFLFGIGSGASTLLSQFWGQKELQGIRRSLGFASLISFSGSLVFCVVVGIFIPSILRLYTTDTEVIAVGVEYFRAVLFSYPFQAIAFIFISGFRSIERAGAMFPVALGAVVMNVVLDIVMVFGYLGFPAMGVVGSAYATVITMVVQLGVIFGIVLFTKNEIRGPISDFFHWTKRSITQFLRVVSPVIVNEVLWSLGTTMYFIVFGRMGTRAITAFNIGSLLFRLVLVGGIGSGQAATVLIGKMVGGNRLHIVKRYISKLLPASFLVAVGLSGILCSLAWVIPNIYNLEGETKALLTYAIFGLTPLFILRIVNLHIIIGILRGGADTKFAMYLEILSIWGIGVPFAFLLGLVLEAGPVITMIGLATEEIVKLAIGLYRLRSDAWIKTLHANV